MWTYRYCSHKNRPLDHVSAGKNRADIVERVDTFNLLPLSMECPRKGGTQDKEINKVGKVKL